MRADVPTRVHAGDVPLHHVLHSLHTTGGLQPADLQGGEESEPCARGADTPSAEGDRPGHHAHGCRRRILRVQPGKNDNKAMKQKKRDLLKSP